MSQKTPVILIHGFLATPTLMRPMKYRLERQGFRVHLVDLSPFAIQDVNRLSLELAKNIDRIRAREGADEVDLVGVSQGGFIGLNYIQEHPGRHRVRRFVAVGTPFGGTWFAAVGLPILGAFSKGVWQALPNSDLVRRMQARGLPEDVGAFSIALEGDPVAPPDRCRLEGGTNEILPEGGGPLGHQWLVLGAPAAEAIARHLA